MRSFVACCALVLCATQIHAAEKITASDGTSYTRAADGQLYPSAHVRTDGSVSLTPLSAAAAGAPMPSPAIRIAPPAPAPCPNGRCPSPGLLPPSVIR